MRRKKWLIGLAALAALLLGCGLGAGTVYASAPGNDEGESLPLLSSLTASGGTVTVEGREAVFAFRESGFLQSPELDVPRGSQYSALLPLRNTVVLHLKNESDTESCRLMFVTDTDRSYSESKSKVFPLGRRGEYTTHYVNLSDTGAEGYLYGFRLQPLGGSGTLRLDGVSFEREDRIETFAGKIDSCLAENGRVTVRGTLGEAYAGQTVTLYRTGISNFSESPEGLAEVGRTTPSGASFSIDFPLYREGVTELSSRFLAMVGDVKVARAFQIQNYRDFSENPYAFETGEISVKAADYGGKGDGFTDDTQAIQAAIDDVSRRGGGTVLLEGDASAYGRRYVATSVTLKDGVELRIEEGAMLLQSSRRADYTYDAVYGHNIEVPGVQWTHAGLCHNTPLIYAKGARKIRVTGGGTIRSMDTGSESEDGRTPATLTVGCAYRIHVLPIGFYDCEDVEISDLTIERTNNYHIALYQTKNVYLGNVTMDEVTCESGDGISLAVGTRNVLIDRCSLYTNDDAVALWSTSNAEPRGMTWWKNNPDGDNRIMNISVERSDLDGGHGITFITWGSDAKDQAMQEISDITVRDNVLAGNVNAIGAWHDNPYTAATDDLSPIRGVRILNNRYESAVSLYGAVASDFVSDCGLEGSGTLLNSALTHLGWWETRGACSAENGSASVKNGRIRQGLTLTGGPYSFTANVGGTGKLAAWDASGRVLAERNFTRAGAQTLTFTADGPGLYYVGLETSSEASFSTPALNGGTAARAAFFSQNFEQAAAFFDEYQWSRTESAGNTVLSAAGKEEISLLLNADYGDFDFRTDVTLRKAGGFSLLFSRSATGYYRAEYDGERKTFRLSRTRSGKETLLRTAYDVGLERDRTYDLGLTRRETELSIYLDGKLVLRAEDGERKLPMGTFSLLAWGCEPELDNFSMREAGTYTDFSEPVYDKYFTENFDDNSKSFLDWDWRRVDTASGRGLTLGKGLTSGSFELSNLYDGLDMSFELTAAEIGGKGSFRIDLCKSGKDSYRFEWSDGTLRIRRFENGMDEELASQAFAFERGRPYAVRLRVKGGELLFSVGGVRLEAKDSHPLGEGSVGVLVSDFVPVLQRLTVAEAGALDLGSGCSGCGGGGTSAALGLLALAAAAFGKFWR